MRTKLIERAVLEAARRFMAVFVRWGAHRSSDEALSDAAQDLREALSSHSRVRNRRPQ